MRKKDKTEKALENYNDVFADIVNALVFDGDQIIKGTELEQVLPKELYKDEIGKLHEQERDVVKAWKHGSIRIAILGFENQTDVDYDMPLRVISYDGNIYGTQVRNKAQSQRYPVITLVLYFGTKTWNGPKSLKERLTIPKRAEKFVNDYKIHIIEMGKLSRKEIERFQSDFRVVLEYFWHDAAEKEYDADDRELNHPQEVADLMYALTQDERFKVNVEKRQKERRKNTMRSWMLDKIEARGREAGEASGLSSCAVMVRMYNEGKDIDQIAEETGKDETIVKSFLVEAGLIAG